MSGFAETQEGHPAGEGPGALRDVAREAVKVDTFGGTVHVEWDPDAAVTPLGHLAFFAEYLKVSGRFDALVADCPLHYTSPNAPSKRDVLGTILLSVLAGQSRYAHMLDRGMKRLLRGEGLPLYVSIFESEDILTDLAAVGGKLLDLWDTPPSEFRHIQSLPPEERKAAILASAAVPIVLQARRLGPDDRRYVDGVMGGYRARQGNTPAEPLVEQAGCTHLIVTHSSDGSPWRRDRFPDTTVLEIRPGSTMRRAEGFAGETRDMFNFSEDIRSWIEQGYRDAMRCVDDVKRSLDLTGRARQAREHRRCAVDALDDDGFRVD